MRIDLFDKGGKLFGFVDSSKNRDIENVGLLIVSTTDGKRYFRFDGGHYLNSKNPKFVECEVMWCFFKEIEPNSNDRANEERA